MSIFNTGYGSQTFDNPSAYNSYLAPGSSIGQIGQTGAGMDPMTWAAILGFGGSLLNGIEGSQQANANRALSRDELAAQIAQQEKARALQATQMDPFIQQKSRQKQALLDMLMQNYSPSTYSGGHFSGGMQAITPDMFKSLAPFSSESAMANNEQAFNATAAAGSKYYMPTDPTAAGYSQSAVNQLPPFNFPGAPDQISRKPANSTILGQAVIRDPALRARTRSLNPRSGGI